MAEALAFDQVSAGYGDAVVLDRLSFDLAQGQSLAILGRNGVGKTTLLETLMGNTRVSHGQIRWQLCADQLVNALRDVGKLPAAVRKIPAPVREHMAQRHVRIALAQLLQTRIQRTRDAPAAHWRALLQLLDCLFQTLRVATTHGHARALCQQ